VDADTNGGRGNGASSDAKPAHARCDIVVVGASWGGVETLRQLVSALPPDLSASLFVVLHLSPESRSRLPELLTRAGPLRACKPRENEPIRPGVIYVAPPDRHMLLERGTIRLSSAARENRCRPAIDPLFRSAARVYGPRVAGVVLTGAQDDGTAGLLRVKATGGVTIVQDPAEAFCPDMPRSALARVEVDYCLPVAAIATTLVALASAPAAVAEATVPGARMREMDLEDERPSPFTCPDCHGMTWMKDGEVVEFRCRVGHRYSQESMVEAQTDAVERAQWAALRALEEKAELHRRLAARRRDRSHTRFAESARAAEEQVRTLRAALVGSAARDAAGAESSEKMSEP